MATEKINDAKKPAPAPEPKPAPIAQPNPMAVNVLQNGLSDAEVEKRGDS